MRIAVSTNDGVAVNQHFGKASSFYIYDIKDGVIKAVERRDVESYCQNNGGVVVDLEHGFKPSRFNQVFEVIKDCQQLYTQKIGDTPKENLLAKGIKVKQCSCTIESLVSCNGNCI